MATQSESIGAIEAILFAYGEPMSIERLAALVQVSVSEVENLIQQLDTQLTEAHRGIGVLRHGAQVQLVSHPQYAPYVSELLRQEMSQELGAAALETLALIAYFGPMPRHRIDHVRGVSSAMSLRTLMVRGMVERTREGKGEHQYQITAECLRELGIQRRDDLPDFATLSTLLERSLASRDTTEGVAPSATDNA